ncbi:MAG: glycosyl transferase [Patescibacteria group bacterium]|nr:MAG: glycosyl transferase [Patescibacteria group bacterium]
MTAKKLKIAMIAPITERVPPKKYGGIERVVHALTEELVRRGHSVTLFATGDSITSAKLEYVYPRALREAKIKELHGFHEWTIYHILSAYMQQQKFDIIHDHNSLWGLLPAQFAKTPTVITLHGPITPNNRRLYEKVTTPYLVAISKSQSQHVPSIKITDTIYNGLPLENHPFGKTHKGYLLFVGRISMEKGTHYAIDVASDLHLPLIIAAKLDEVDREYFKEYIEPRINGEQIRWIGEVDEVERNKLMSGAMALLHPVTWREPFGLTLIEAMACGTPVVAFNKGSIPEIVIDGKTGFVVKDVEEMILAIAKISQIDRRECRKHVLQHFTATKMSDNYEQLYLRILERRSL